MPAPPTTSNPFYMNMAKKRQMMLEAQQAAAANVKPPVMGGPKPPIMAPPVAPAGTAPIAPVPPVGGGNTQQTGGLTQQGGGTGIVPPAPIGALPPTTFPGGEPIGGRPPGGDLNTAPGRAPILAPPIPLNPGAGRAPVAAPVGGGVGNAPGPIRPQSPQGPPIMDRGGDLGVDPATIEAEKRKAQGNFFKRRMPPQVPQPTGPPIFSGGAYS